MYDGYGIQTIQPVQSNNNTFPHPVDKYAGASSAIAPRAFARTRDNAPLERQNS
jgi:hypothetical protein